MNKVEKFGLEGAIDIANKYLEQPINTGVKENFLEVSAFTSSGKGKRDKSKALLTLQNGQKIEVEENSLLYEKLLSFAKREMLRVGADHFISPSMVAEFEDLDRSVDYSKKDVEKPIHVPDTSWKAVFGEVER